MGGDARYPPATDPIMRNGSCPDTTASGRGASGGSWERSSSQAKNRKNGRRFWLAWSRTVPRSVGKRASSASITELCVTGRVTSSMTSPSHFAKVRKCAGRTTRIMAGSGPPRNARQEGPAQWRPNCPRNRPTHTPGLRLSQNTRRMSRGNQWPWHCATH